MKRFAALALILCIGLFTIGCEKPKDKPKKDGDTAAAADKDAAPDAKADAKKEEKK